MEQGPVKISVQTFGLFLTPTLAALVPVLGPTLVHPPAHTCPASTMMMYFWVSTNHHKVWVSFALLPPQHEQRAAVYICVAYASECFSPYSIYSLSVCVCVVPPPPTCMIRADGFPLPCVLLMLDAAARCYRGPRVRVGFIQPLNERGCRSVIITHTNTSTSIVIQLPVTVKLPSMQHVCHLKLHRSDLTLASPNEPLRVFWGHVLICVSVSAFCFL